jgi:hypothetical protein
MHRSIKTFWAATAFLLLFTLLMTLTSLTGCKTQVRVISSDQTILFLNPGQTFTATNSGVYMSDALYQRYRRAVADKIQEEQLKK